MPVDVSQRPYSVILTILVCVGLILLLAGAVALAFPEILAPWWRLAIWLSGVLVYGSASVSQLLDIPLLTARRRRAPGSQRRMGVLSAATATLCGLLFLVGVFLR